MATVKLTGFKELEKELDRFSKATGKGVLRRALKKSAQPMADLMHDMAPRGETATDNLAESISVGTKLSKRQAGQHKKMFRDDRAAVEMFVGPGPDPAAWNQEFGNVNHGPQPFVRPAWDQDRMDLLDRLANEMWSELYKSIARAERKAARQAGG
ncbi:MAG: HK97 gp10 family phage protein [Parasphingorhabdus sp.]|uniref:HK97 gp10 family phage protein n=1 Tax=Alphaproteobacteria TaxID=28211 RepID=UPI003267FC59